MRAAAWAALLAFAALAAGPSTAQEAAPRVEAEQVTDELLREEGIGGDFTLHDARGKARSLAEFRGKVVVLYFGFVTCPDICPTDLLAIGRAIRALGADGRGVQPIFVTLDPVRDTPAMLGEYVRNFHPRLLALTGTEAEIARVAAAYKVFHRKVPLASGAGYTIDHSAYLYILDRDGRYAGFIPPGTDRDRIARQLHAQLRSGKSRPAR